MDGKDNKDGISPENNGGEVDGEYTIKVKSKNSNLWLRLLSVFLAFILWIYVMGVESPTFTATLSVPITILQSGAPLSVISGYSSSVDVTLQGKRAEIASITADDLEAYVDISGYTVAGRYSVPVTISVPGSLKITEQSFGTVSLYLDNTSTKSVPIKVKLVSYMLEDGELGVNDIETNLSEVNVTGPSALLDTIESAEVSLSLGKITKTATVSAPITLVDSDGQIVSNPYVKLAVSEAVVTVPVYFYKTLPLEVDYKYGFFNPKTVNLTINPSSVKVKGEIDALDAVSRILLTTLDEKKVTTDTITLPITMPSGLINVSGSEEAVITIEHLNTTEREIVCSDITVINPGGFDYQLLSDSINVTLRGTQPYINYMAASNISATVDLSALSDANGVMSVPVSFVIDGVYSHYVYEVGDYKISVSVN